MFDTLVWRPVAVPSHLFLRLGADLSANGMLPDHVTPDVFALSRSTAERRARERVGRRHRSQECTLEEIWDEMPLRWRREGDRSWDEYIDTELRCEERHLQPIDAGIELLRVAAAHGCRVVLVSDTYLSTSQLHQLLTVAGVPMELVAEVVTSSDRRLNKSDGLLEAVVAEQGVEPAAVLHVGDHPLADLEAARRAGLVAVQLDRPKDQDQTPAMTAALKEFSEVSGTDGGTLAITRRLLLDAGGGDGVDAAYHFGVSVGGPLLCGFADWIVERARDLDVATVHYLLREGAFIADVVAASCVDPPDAVRLHASRWVNMRATVYEGSFDELFRSLARRGAFHPRHVTEAFDIEPAVIERVVGSGSRDDIGRAEAIEALAADDEVRNRIIEASALLRRRLMRYLEPRLRPENGRIVVCDIGWGGTIQESLTDLLRHEGWDVDVFGLYLMLSGPGRERVARGARMTGFLPTEGRHRPNSDIIMRTPEIAEQLCTPDLGTLVDIDDDGEPVLAPVPTAARASRARARAGVIDFATTRREVLPHACSDDRLHGPVLAAALLDGLAGTIGAPHPAIARELGSWEHDDVRGRGHEPLVNPETVGAVDGLNAADLDLVGMRDLYWVPGAAATRNPSLAAQLDAVRLGVEATQLCPPSELGTALVAVFVPGRLDAVGQVRHVPHLDAMGRMVLRLSASGPGLRDVRVDFGETDGLVEIDRIELRWTAASGEVSECLVTTFDDARLRWVGGWPTGRRHAVLTAGGHVVVPWPHDTDGVLSATVIWRAWPLGDDDVRSLRPTARHRLRSLADVPTRAARRVRSTGVRRR